LKQINFVGDILNVAIDVFKRKELEDAFIVPVSISYEKLPEQEIVECAQIEPTECGSVGSLSLWKLLRSSLGYARIDISQPFRLRVSFLPVNSPFVRVHFMECSIFCVHNTGFQNQATIFRLHSFQQSSVSNRR
jgi:hypothetical protein